MNRPTAGPWAAAFGLACLLLVHPHAADAELRWGLGRWEGDGTFLLDWENQNDKRTNDRYQTMLFEERLRLRNAGAWVLDPRFLTLDLGGSFGGSEEIALTKSNTGLRVGNGILYDYSFQGLLLADSAYPTTFFATRSQTVRAQGFGGRTDLTFQSLGGTFDLHENSFLESLGWRGITGNFDVRQESLLENSLVFGNPFRRDETRRIVTAQAHRAGENSDLDLRYELNSVNDPLNASDVFDSHTLRLSHSLDFGPTLNRRFDSGVYFFTRSGASQGTYVSDTESLHIDHSRDLSSDLRYDFSQSDSASGTTTSNTLGAGLMRRFYRNLTTTADVRGAYQTFPDGTKYYYGGRAAADYRRTIPASGELFVSTHVGYQVDDNNFTSSLNAEPDERHLVPIEVGTGAGFTLVHPFVDNLSIVVVDLGPTGTSRFDTVVNVDYALVADGSGTKVVPLPDSAVLKPGDQVSVSYSYNVAPSLRYSTLDAGVRAGVEFPWLTLSYEYLMSDQARLAGQSLPQFLIDQNVNRIQLELHHGWKRLRAQSTVGYEILRSTIIDSNALRLGQLLIYQFGADVTAQVGGDEYFVDYPGENRRSVSYLARASLDWAAGDTLLATPFADYRSFHDSLIPSDDIIEAGLRVRWTWRNVDIYPTITWTDYRSRLDGIRGELRITRRFF